MNDQDHDCKASFTVQQLRSLLFVMPQDITVKQLRRVLYDLQDQRQTVYQAEREIEKAVR